MWCFCQCIYFLFNADPKEKAPLCVFGVSGLWDLPSRENRGLQYAALWETLSECQETQEPT